MIALNEGRDRQQFGGRYNALSSSAMDSHLKHEIISLLYFLKPYSFIL